MLPCILIISFIFAQFFGRPPLTTSEGVMTPRGVLLTSPVACLFGLLTRLSPGWSLPDNREQEAKKVYSTRGLKSIEKVVHSINFALHNHLPAWPFLCLMPQSQTQKERQLILNMLNDFQVVTINGKSYHKPCCYIILFTYPTHSYFNEGTLARDKKFLWLFKSLVWILRFCILMKFASDQCFGFNWNFMVLQTQLQGFLLHTNLHR